MKERELLELVENLFEAAAHPEVTDISRVPGDSYSPAGVKVAFENGAKGMLLLYPRDGWPKAGTQIGGGR
ncbi:hypothetical protein OG792_12270 [Micromonospora sp. NBC_01699]|uniref:hypothetical protein n=1 Tax=Micromonospora sp. NBC_01699 TaxID=2975984 RepID=UPI002E30A477|nr:hypothetical protein [Micromonospora sp. NBC_01699]